MKKLINFSSFLILFVFTHAQQNGWVLDKEKLFSGDEVKRIDSVLQAYQKKSGNLLALYTDSADISVKDFEDKVYTLFKTPQSDNKYSYILMMSRNHSFLFSTVNKTTAPFVNQQLLVSILETGFTSFKEKRREEGVIIIFIKAMEFLDGLPKR